MEEDANINPLWDSLMGETTSVAVPRTLAGILAFVVAGGAIFWSIG